MNLATSESVTPPLKFYQKLCYGFGQLAEGLQNGAFEAFLFFYYTQVLGLSGTLSGTAVLIALLFDAVTDPMIGSMSDSAKTRWGRRHPFMLFGLMPMVIGFYLLFTPPAGLSTYGLFAWLTGLAIVVRGGMTLFLVPFTAMTAEFTSDPNQRTVLVGFRMLFSILGWLSVSLIGTMYFFRATPEFELGTLNPEAYPAFAMAIAIAISIPVVVSTVSTFFLRDRLFDALEGDTFSFRGLRDDIYTAMSFPAYRLLVISGLMAFMATGIRLALLVHLKSFFFELSSKEIGYTMMATLIGMLSGLALWTLISRRLEKKTCYMIGVSWMGFFAMFPVAVYYFSWLPDSSGHGTLLLLVIGSAFLAGLGGSCVALMTNSMLADLTDENELKTGRRQEGIYFGTMNFLHKSSSGLGHFVAGMGLDLIAFPRDAVPGEVAADIVNRLGFLYGPGILLFCLIAALIMWRYPLTRRRQSEISAQLKRQRSSPLEKEERNKLEG